MLLFTNQTPGTVVVAIRDSKIVGENQIPDIRTCLVNHIADCANTNRLLVLDLCTVQFMSSGVFNLLVEIYKLANNDSVKFRLANVNSAIVEVLAILRLDKILLIDDDDDGFLGSAIQNPISPSSLDGHGEPSKE